MADKLTQQITDALTRVAADPAGLPLYASKAEPGLFPNTTVAKPAAQKCLADDLLRALPADGKSKRELYALTEKGWEFLLAAVNPKQVLEDFVRVLEARQGAVGELLESARSMASSLQGLKDAVTRVLPSVTAAKVEKPAPQPPPYSEGVSARLAPLGPLGASESEGSFPPSLPPRAAEIASASEAWHAGTSGGGRGVGLLDAPPATDLAPAVIAHLSARAAATDCPLPDLFRALACNGPLTIGEFHDCLRQMCADGVVSLPAWTGPLYALPEPQYALLIGHGIAYYASLRN